MRVTQRQSGTHLQRVQRQSPGREASVGVHARVQGAQRDGARRAHVSARVGWRTG